MSDTNDAKEQARLGVAGAADELIDVSRRIHANPELAMEEHQAAALLSERLEAHGFQVKRGVSWLSTAFSATWGEGTVTIAYLLEYDALPEIGHACGHNLIATAGLGAGPRPEGGGPPPPGGAPLLRGAGGGGGGGGGGGAGGG